MAISSDSRGIGGIHIHKHVLSPQPRGYINFRWEFGGGSYRIAVLLLMVADWGNVPFKLKLRATNQDSCSLGVLSTHYNPFQTQENCV